MCNVCFIWMQQFFLFFYSSFFFLLEFSVHSFLLFFMLLQISLHSFLISVAAGIVNISLNSSDGSLSNSEVMRHVLNKSFLLVWKLSSHRNMALDRHLSLIILRLLKLLVLQVASVLINLLMLSHIRMSLTKQIWVQNWSVLMPNIVNIIGGRLLGRYTLAHHLIRSKLSSKRFLEVLSHRLLLGSTDIEICFLMDVFWHVFFLNLIIFFFFFNIYYKN